MPSETKWHCSWYDHWEQNFPKGYSQKPGTQPCTDKYCRAVITKCPNYNVCGESHPADLLDCWGGRCSSCDMMFGIDFKNIGNGQCDICMTEGKLVVFPMCPSEHTIGVQCLKNMIDVVHEKYESDPNIEPIHLKCPICRSQAIPDYLKSVTMSIN